MNKTKSLYTAGVIITLWRIILLTKRYGENDVVIQDIVNSLESSGFLGGTVPIKESVRLGQKYSFLIIRDGKVSVGDYSQKMLLPFCDDEIPNIMVLRKILLLIISKNKFHWVLFYNEDIPVFKVAIPQDWIDLLENAKLFDITDKDVVAWWSGLSQLLQTYDDELLKKIGNFGESLTFKFENKRLLADGFAINPFDVTWVSRISDIEGYDIKSIRGTLLKLKKSQKDKIQIEVKASVISNTDRFRFMVSRNEWNTALSNIDSYFFYCWSGINLANQSFLGGPFIIPARKIENLFPHDNHESFQWSECRVVVDLEDFQIN